MTIPKRNLRKRVVLGEKTNQDFEFKKSVTNEKDIKKKYNLRKSDKLGSVNENQNFQINTEKQCMLNNAADVPCTQSKINDVNKENKVKLKGKRQVIKLDHTSKIKSGVSNGKSDEKRLVQNQKNLESIAIPYKVGTIPIWRKNLPNLKKICARKKNFDIYDISQDEDMTRIGKAISKKVKTISKKRGNSVKIFLNKGVVSKKGLKSTQKIPDPKLDKSKTSKPDDLMSNPSCSVQIQAKSIEVPLQTDQNVTEKPCLSVESNKHLKPTESFDATEIYIPEPLNFEIAPPELTCYDATTILLNVADDFEKSLLHPRMTSTPDTAVMATAPPKNNSNLILNNISHIASNNRNIVKVVIDTPDSVPVKISSKGLNDVTLFKLPEPLVKKNAAMKFPQKPVPKMTSTPNIAAMSAMPSKNNILNDISHIPSNNRDIVQVVIDTPDPLPAKKSKKRSADVTLFESPEPKKKNPPNLSKSPQKSVQMNLLEHFLLSPEKSLDESVKKPTKAYHTPDNFKTHLARTKRISEVTRIEKKKSKEDLLIEQMAKHFEEVSGMELCIE